MCAQDAASESAVTELFPAHLCLGEIQAGLKSGKFVQGKFHRSRDNCFEAYVSVYSSDEQVCAALMNTCVLPS